MNGMLADQLRRFRRFLFAMFLLIQPTSCISASYCQTVYNSCSPNSQINSASNHSKGPQQDDRKHVTITTIIPLTDCYSGLQCQVTEFRALDVIGLQLAIITLPPPTNYCVDILLCDSFHDPIKAVDIIGSYNFHESCDQLQQECPRNQVCFSQCYPGEGTCNNHVAVIGPGTPQEGKALADLTSALEIPQLLYSTGSSFSDSERYEYLHQVAPHYHLQVDKILEIITEMNWRYIAVLTTADTYGKLGYELLKKEFDAKRRSHEGVEKNCCLQFSTTMLTFRMEFSDIEAQLRVLEKRTTVIVLWMEGKYVEKVLNYFKRSGRNNTVYIASDGWAIDSKIHSMFEDILSNRFIGVFPDIGEIMEDDTMAKFIKLHDQHCQDLDWMGTVVCNKTKRFITDSKMFGYAGGILASLRALYSALNSSDKYDIKTTRALRQHLNKELKRSLKSVGGEIRVYTMPGSKVSLAENRSHYPSDIVSRCSEPCQPHQYARLLKKSPRCCFTCKSCSSNSIVRRQGELEYCQPCDMCHKPSDNHSICIAKELEQFSILNGDGFSVSVFLVSVLGIFCNMFVLGSLVRHSTTPIVKASSPQLCYIMLVSLMLLLTAPILMVSGPGDVTCPLQRYIIGIGIVIPIAVLFARSNRINVIFNRSSLLTSSIQKMVMRLKYNILIVAFFAAIQFCICAILHAHHEQRYHENGGTGKKIHVKTSCNKDVTKSNFMMCNEDRMDLVYLWIGYICMLILATTVVAFKTRRLPTNFNEARYICLVMFVILVLTISTISTYIVLDNQVNIMYQCWSIITAVYAILIIIYGQKMYVIYVMPDQNRRQDTNIALDKFIKRSSENRMNSYSQLLIRPVRLSTTDSLSLNSNSKPATPTSSRFSWRSISVGGSPLKLGPVFDKAGRPLTVKEKRALFKRASAVSDHVKLSGEEKRAIFREQKREKVHRRTKSVGYKASASPDRDLDPLASIKAELGIRYNLRRSSSG